MKQNGILTISVRTETKKELDNLKRLAAFKFKRPVGWDELLTDAVKIYIKTKS